MKTIGERNRILLVLERENKLIGKTLPELEKLLGTASSLVGRFTVYRLDSGFGGFKWRFMFEAGRVVRVEKESLD